MHWTRVARFELAVRPRVLELADCRLLTFYIYIRKGYRSSAQQVGYYRVPSREETL